MPPKSSGSNTLMAPVAKSGTQIVPGNAPLSSWVMTSRGWVPALVNSVWVETTAVPVALSRTRRMLP